MMDKTMRESIRYSFLIAAIVGMVTVFVGIAAACRLKYIGLVEVLFLSSGAVIAVLLRGDNYVNEMHFLQYAIPSAIIINAFIAFLLSFLIRLIFTETK
jgi:hypothetical protein